MREKNKTDNSLIFYRLIWMNKLICLSLFTYLFLHYWSIKATVQLFGVVCVLQVSLHSLAMAVCVKVEPPH